VRTETDDPVCLCVAQNQVLSALLRPCAAGLDAQGSIVAFEVLRMCAVIQHTRAAAGDYFQNVAFAAAFATKL
jgi:hypothetical protein